MNNKRIDMSTRVAVQAAERLLRVRTRVKEMIPYGPMNVKLSPAEALAKIQGLSPLERMQLAQRVGVDEFLRTMQQLETKAGGNG